MKDELISVIIPVYNVEKYLDNCLDSVINQSYKNLEIILVDDGSTDNSGKICDNYAKNDKRIKVIHKDNYGLSSARNVGIEVSKGKYITFIDSDDDIEKDYTEYLYQLLKKYDTKMSICPIISIRKEKIDTSKLIENNYILSTEECLRKMLCEDEITVSACGKLYERKLFNDISFPLSKLCEDNGTTYKLIMKCNKIAFGNVPKYNYYVRTNSIMTSDFNIKKLDLLELTDIMCSDINKKYKSLKDYTTKREIHSRFSILRQMSNQRLDKKSKDEQNKIIKYLKERKKIVLKSNMYDKREKLAMISLLFGKSIFNFSWNLYNKLRG